MRWNNVDALLNTLGNGRFWASTSTSKVQLGGLDRLLVVASDVSEQRQLTELLGYQATHDALTGLCNRRAFARSVRRELEAVARGGPAAGVSYIAQDQLTLIIATAGTLPAVHLFTISARAR